MDEDKMVDYIDKFWSDAHLAGYTTPGWYFWDEACQCTGPYETEEQAEKALTKYIEGHSL
jgi:hypothetical protein